MRADGRCRPKLATGVDWVALDGEVVVVDAQDRVHLLADTAAVLWPFLDGHVTLEALADDLACVTDGSTDEVLSDLVEFCRSAHALGLLTDERTE